MNVGRVKVAATSTHARMSTSSLVIIILSTLNHRAMYTPSQTAALLGIPQTLKSNTGPITSMTFSNTTMVVKVSRAMVATAAVGMWWMLRKIDVVAKTSM